VAESKYSNKKVIEERVIDDAVEKPDEKAAAASESSDWESESSMSSVEGPKAGKRVYHIAEAEPEKKKQKKVVFDSPDA